MSKKNGATIYDIAANIGVSAGTVSRALNGHRNVSSSVKRKIALAARELEFVPRKRLGLIAVAISDPSRLDSMGYGDQVIAMLAHELKKYGYLMKLIDTRDIDILQLIDLDAVIGIVFGPDTQRLAECFPRELRVPVITVNCPMTEYGFHNFCVNHRQGAREATRELIRNGHRRIAFLEAQDENWGSRERQEGYREALAEAGIEFDPSLMFFTMHTMLHDVVEALKIKDVTGVVNCSEDVALDFNHYLGNILKMNIPEDISVVTIEVGFMQRYMSPPQTVIHQPLRQVIEQLGANLGEIIADRDGKNIFNVVIDSELVKRNSVKCVNNR